MKPVNCYNSLALHNMIIIFSRHPFTVTDPLTVQRCSAADGDFVYKIDEVGAVGCHFSLCTMD